MKKANLSLQVVVIASILLVVLVVLTIIFAGRMSLWNEGIRHCDTVCKEKAAECQEAGYDEIAIYVSNCKDAEGNVFKSNAYCCKVKR